MVLDRAIAMLGTQGNPSPPYLSCWDPEGIFPSTYGPVPTSAVFSNIKYSFSYDSMVANLESAHGQQLSDWNKKGERIERQLTNIETEWQRISFLENSNEDEITEYRTQLEVKNRLMARLHNQSFCDHSRNFTWVNDSFFNTESVSSNTS
jgi:hypothetical protein